MEQRRKLFSGFLRHPGFWTTLCLTLLVTLASQFGAFAATNPANIISYQGRLLDTNGVPVSAASATMIFRFYDAPSGGSCLWSNSSSMCASATGRTVTLTDGLFSENLGDFANDGYSTISDTVFSDHTSVYLDVNVNGESLTPRKLMTASPYALNAQALDGLSSNSYLNLSGNTLGSTDVFTIDAYNTEHVATSAFNLTYKPTSAAGLSSGSITEVISPAAGLMPGQFLAGSIINLAPDLDDSTSDTALVGTLTRLTAVADNGLVIGSFLDFGSNTGGYSGASPREIDGYTAQISMEPSLAETDTNVMIGFSLTAKSVGANKLNELTGFQFMANQLDTIPTNLYGMYLGKNDGAVGGTAINIEGNWNTAIQIGSLTSAPYGITFNNVTNAISSSGGDIKIEANVNTVVNLPASGDFLVKDNGATFFSFLDDGTTSQTFTSGTNGAGAALTATSSGLGATGVLAGQNVTVTANGSDLAGALEAGTLVNLDGGAGASGRQGVLVYGSDDFNGGVLNADPLIDNGSYVGLFSVLEATPAVDNQGRVYGASAILSNTGSKYAQELWGYNADITDLVNTGTFVYGFRVNNEDASVDGDAAFIGMGNWEHGIDLSDTTMSSSSILFGNAAIDLQAYAGNDLDIYGSASGGNVNINLPDTGDLIIKNNGVAFATFTDASNTVFTLPATSNITIDASSTNHTDNAPITVSLQSDAAGWTSGLPAAMQVSAISTGMTGGTEYLAGIVTRMVPNASDVGNTGVVGNIAILDSGVATAGQVVGFEVAASNYPGLSTRYSGSSNAVGFRSSLDADPASNGVGSLYGIQSYVQNTGSHYSGNLVGAYISVEDLLNGATNADGVIVHNEDASISGDHAITISGLWDTGISTSSTIVGSQHTLNGASTANGAGAASATLILNNATNFEVGNYVKVTPGTGNCSGSQTICYAKITNKASNTLTISPALTWDNAAAVDEVYIPEIGMADIGDVTTLGGRFGRGYFIDGVVAGNGTTYLTDGMIKGSTSLRLTTGTNTGLNINSSGEATFGGAVNVSGNILPQATASGLTERSVNTVATGVTPEYTAIVIGDSGKPMIAYDPFNTLKLINCQSTNCAPLKHTIDSTNGSAYNSIAVPSDGKPVIAYQGDMTNVLMVAKCDDAACTTAAKTIVDNSGSVGYYTSLAIGADDLPIISYYDQTNTALKVLHCGNADCSSGNTTTTLDNSANVGKYSSITVPLDGLAVISYEDETNFTLLVAKCANTACTSTSISPVVVDSSAAGETWTSITTNASSYPIISYHDEMANTLRVAACTAADCSGSVTKTTVDATSGTGTYSSIAMGLDGKPIIAYDPTDSLKVAKCSTTDCSGSATKTTLDGSVGQYIGITVPADGLPIISYGNGSVMKTAKCDNASCTTAAIYTLASDVANASAWTDVAIGADGFPIIAYDPFAGTLKTYHCLDAACALGQNSVTLDVSNGSQISMAVELTADGGDGKPWIAYYGSGDLYAAQCDNTSCTSATTTLVDATNDIGYYTDIAIGTDHKPVISYFDAFNFKVRVAKYRGSAGGNCDNTGGSDLWDCTEIGAASGYTSIVIGNDGYPFVAYDPGGSLKVAHCTNASCTTFDTPIYLDTSGGSHVSMTVGTDNNPIIAYYDDTNLHLKVAHCTNATCTSGVTLTTVDATTNTGTYNSIMIGSDGLPVIAYDPPSPASLKVAHCGNIGCTGANTLTTVDSIAGSYTSMAISTDGFPVISYIDTNYSTLKVAKCADVTCAAPASYSSGSNLGSTSQFFNKFYASSIFAKSVAISGFDVAEEYLTNDETVGAGDVVSMVSGVNVGKSSGAYDGRLLGVVSEKPGLYLSNWSGDPRSRPIALNGRVPVKVNAENGPIAIGDPLTSSSTPGVAMKATQSGMIIGRALEPYAGAGPGKILVFVNASWSTGMALSEDGSTSIGDLVMDSLATATATEPGKGSHVMLFRGSGWNGTSAEAVGMGLKLAATDATAYRLSFTNKTDTEVAYVTGKGDLVLSGKLYPSDQGVAQNSKYIVYDGSAGPGGDFMRTNASGWATDANDFAELFPSAQALAPGELVVASPAANSSVERSSQTYQKTLLGIVSTKPGFLAGASKAGQVAVALKGRVPTMVNAENGPIAIGDPLTSSSTPGYAMRATKAGPIVGFALEPSNGQSGAIVAFVSLGWWEPDAVVAPVTSTTSGIANTASQAPVGSSTAPLSLENGLFLAGSDILGVRRIAGLADRWSIEEDGTVKTEAAFKAVITSLQNEKIDTYATLNREQKVTLSGTGRLVNGVATVSFESVDPKFDDITSTTAPVRVQVTLRGPANGVYVSQADHNGFEVRELANGTSTVDFDWYVEAYRLGQEPPTMLATPAVEPVPVDAAVAPAPVPTSDPTSTPTTDPVLTSPADVPVPDPTPVVTDPVPTPTAPASVAEPVLAPAPEPVPAPVTETTP